MDDPLSIKKNSLSVIVVFPDHTHLLFLRVLNYLMNLYGKYIGNRLVQKKSLVTRFNKKVHNERCFPQCHRALCPQYKTSMKERLTISN